MKRLYFYWKVFLVLNTFFCVSCNVKQAEMDVEKVKQEIKDRKIKRLTDAEIVQAAYDSGKVIIEQIDFSNAKCNEAILLENDIVESCMLICDSTLLQETKELQVWSAYRYNYANGLEMNDNIQKTTEATLLYTKPITNNIDTTNSSNPRVLFLKLSKKRLILKI